MALAAVFLVLGLLLGPVAVVEQDVRAFGLSLVIISLFGGLLALQVSGRRWPGRRRPVVENLGAGLCFPYRRTLWRALVGSVLVALVAFVFILWFVLTDPDPSRRSREMLIMGPIGLVYTAIAVLNLATGRLRRGHVLLDEEGVTHRSWGHRLHMGWEDVRTVHARTSSGKKARPEIVMVHCDGVAATCEKRALWLGLKARGLPDLVIEAYPVAGDAALLAHSIAFYVEHAEQRAELGDGRALRRVLEGRAVAPSLGSPR